MRTATLARIAAEAEALRWRRRASKIAYRVAYGLVALVFVLAVIAGLQVTGYLALRIWLAPNTWAPVFAALIVMGVDLLIAALFGVMASRGTGTDQVQIEALEVRREAVREMGDVLTTFAVLRPLLRILPKRGLYGLMLATLTARFIGARRR